MKRTFASCLHFVMICSLFVTSLPAVAVNCALEASLQIKIDDFGGMDAVMKKFLHSVHSPSIVDRMERIIPIAAKRKFDNDPMVDYLWRTIAENKFGTLAYRDDNGYFLGNTAPLTKGQNSNPWLAITIQDLRDLSQERNEKFGANTQVSFFMSKLMYGILKGAALRKLQSPELDIQIIGDRVANKMLKKMFTEFGFVYSYTGKPLTESEMESGWRSVHLDLLHVQDM